MQPGWGDMPPGISAKVRRILIPSPAPLKGALSCTHAHADSTKGVWVFFTCPRCRRHTDLLGSGGLLFPKGGGARLKFMARPNLSCSAGVGARQVGAGDRGMDEPTVHIHGVWGCPGARRGLCGPDPCLCSPDARNQATSDVELWPYH